MVGNPAIADVLVQNSQTVYVLGRSYGKTNFIALDASGKQIAQYDLDVVAQSGGVVTLVRGTGQPKKMTAQAGNFQQNLPQNRTFQLLRLHMEQETALIPEISANRLIVTIRMMQQDALGHLVPAQENTDFQLTLCT